MKDDCYWDYPLIGLNGKKENQSKKYRDYYFEHNGNLTSQEVADHFNLKLQTIKNHRSNYQWDDVLLDKKAYESKQRREAQEDNYKKFLDQDANEVTELLNGKHRFIRLCEIKLGLVPNHENIQMPEWLTIDMAYDTVKDLKPETLHKMAIRDFEQPYNIDKQQHEFNNPLEIKHDIKKIFNKDKIRKRYNVRNSTERDN